MRNLIYIFLLFWAGPAAAQLPAFRGSATLDSGPDPVVSCQQQATPFSYTIHLDANFKTTQVVRDTVLPTFVVTRVAPSCGTATVGTKGSNKGKVTWKLTKCDTTLSQHLRVSLMTAQKPGQTAQDTPFFAPRFCGPLFLHEAAVLTDTKGKELSELSNQLAVAACIADGTDGCIDADSDAWSISCGDCNDTDPSINWDQPEKCGDSKDNNCNMQIDEQCL